MRASDGPLGRQRATSVTSAGSVVSGKEAGGALSLRGLVITGLVCFTAVVSHSFGRSIFGLLSPAIVDDLVLSASDIAIPGTAIYAAYLLGVLLVAAFGANFEPVTIMRAGLATAVAGFLIASVAPNVAVLTLGVGLSGLAGAGIWLTAPALATAFVPAHRRGIVIGLLLSTIGLSNIVLGFVTRGLRDRADDDTLWRPIMQIEVGVTALLLAGLVLIARFPQTARIEGGFSLTQLRSVPGWLKLTLAYALFGGMTAAFANNVVLALKERGGFSPEDRATVFIVMGIGGVVLAPVLGALSDRFGRLRMLALSLSVLVAANVFIALGPPALVAVGAVMYGSAAGATPALVATYVRDHADARSFSRVLATMTLLFSVMAAITPAVIGVIADRTGSFTAPFLVMGAMTSVAAVAVAMLEFAKQVGKPQMAAPLPS